MCRNLICPEILWMGSSCLVTALSISRLERKLHAGLLLLQAGGFLCNPHYDWKVNSSAAGQSILGRLSVGEAASGRGERNECEASHPVTAPSPIFSPFAAHVRQSGCTSWELWELLGMAGPGGWAPHASPARSIFSTIILICVHLGSSLCDFVGSSVIRGGEKRSHSNCWFSQGCCSKIIF